MTSTSRVGVAMSSPCARDPAFYDPVRPAKGFPRSWLQNAGQPTSCDNTTFTRPRRVIGQVQKRAINIPTRRRCGAQVCFTGLRKRHRMFFYILRLCLAHQVIPPQPSVADDDELSNPRVRDMMHDRRTFTIRSMPAMIRPEKSSMGQSWNSERPHRIGGSI